MALLDFSEVIMDPDLTSGFSVIQRVETVNPLNGRSTTTSTQIDGLVGVITNGAPGTNGRSAEAQMSSRVIGVITQFRLRAAADGVQPDVVLHLGSRFTVKQVDPWTHFGSGFVVATCELEEASSPPVV